MSNLVNQKLYQNIASKVKDSEDRMMEQVLGGCFQKQNLRNDAEPYRRKQGIYGQSFKRLLKSRNFLFIYNCKGDIDGKH